MTVVVVPLDQLSPIIGIIADGQSSKATIWNQFSDKVHAVIFDLELKKVVALSQGARDALH